MYYTVSDILTFTLTKLLPVSFSKHCLLISLNRPVSGSAQEAVIKSLNDPRLKHLFTCLLEIISVSRCW